MRTKYFLTKFLSILFIVTLVGSGSIPLFHAQPQNDGKPKIIYTLPEDVTIRRSFNWEDLPSPIGEGIEFFTRLSHKGSEVGVNWQYAQRDPLWPLHPQIEFPYEKTPMAKYDVKNLKVEIEEMSEGNLKIHLTGQIDRWTQINMGGIRAEVSKGVYSPSWDPSRLHSYEEQVDVKGFVLLGNEGRISGSGIGKASTILFAGSTEGPQWAWDRKGQTIKTTWASEEIGLNGAGEIGITINGKIEDLAGVEFKLSDDTIAAWDGISVAVDIGQLAMGVKGIHKAVEKGGYLAGAAKGVKESYSGEKTVKHIINLPSASLPLWFDGNEDLWVGEGEDAVKMIKKPITPTSAGAGDWDPEWEETWYWEGWNYPTTDVAYENYQYVDESGAYEWDYDQSEIEEAWEWAPYI
jgi:hypothetical protein